MSALFSKDYPYPVEEKGATRLCTHEGGSEIILANDVDPAVLRLVRRGTMFPLMLAAMTLAEQALFRANNQEGILYPNDVIDCKEAWSAIRAVIEIIGMRHLHDPDEQDEALEVMKYPGPVAVLLETAVKALRLLEQVEVSDWEAGAAETNPEVEKIREALRPFTDEVI